MRARRLDTALSALLLPPGAALLTAEEPSPWQLHGPPERAVRSGERGRAAALQSNLAAVARQSACGQVSQLFTAPLKEEDFYQDVAAAELAPWRQSGIRREDLDKARALGRPLVKYQILGGHLYRDEKCYFPARCEDIEHFLLEIAPELPDVEFLRGRGESPATAGTSSKNTSPSRTSAATGWTCSETTRPSRGSSPNRTRASSPSLRRSPRWCSQPL